MSIKVMSQVWEHSLASGAELLCLLAIADFADDSGKAYPAVETIAKKIKMSERNARYTLKKLKQGGELVIHRNAGPKGCNLYEIRIGKELLNASLAPAKIAPANLAPLQLVVSTPAMDGILPLQPIAPEPSLTVNNRHEQTFAQFWAAYPKKVSKPDARKAWDKLKPDDNLLEAVLRGLENAIVQDHRFRGETKFIPHPASWLNSRGWEDFSDGGGFDDLLLGAT